MSRRRHERGPRKRPTARQLLFRLFIVITVMTLIFSAGYIVSRVKGAIADYRESKRIEKEEKEKSDLIQLEASFRDAILIECRETGKLVVSEQDVAVTTDLSKALLGWDVFKKTQSYTTYGTGYYAVDLTQLTSDAIVFNKNGGVIKITIPECFLMTVTPDYEKTQFEDTEHGLLSWGDIKITPEQQNEVELQIMQQLEEKLLSRVCMNKARTAALDACKELFESVLDPLGKYYIIVKFED